MWWETADNDGYMYVGLKSFIFINHSKLGMLQLLKLFFNVVVYVVVEAIFILPEVMLFFWQLSVK